MAIYKAEHQLQHSQSQQIALRHFKRYSGPNPTAETFEKVRETAGISIDLRMMNLTLDYPEPAEGEEMRHRELN